jgi:hypothetical protein
MPDMTTITARMCKSVQEFTTIIPSDATQEGYIVTYRAYNPDGSVDGWECECRDFVYRRRMCKHIERARKQHCQHGWEGLIGSPTDMGARCPKCNGPTVVVEVAV